MMMKLVDLAVRIEHAMGNIKNLRSKDFTLKKLDDELQCMGLIKALPEEYSHFSTFLLLLDVMEQPLVSYLILSTMPLLSYQMNYPTLQFGCYGTAFLFNLLHFIIVWSCGHYYKV